MQNRKPGGTSNFDIYILDLESRNLTRFTEHWAIETYPAWSPDGKFLAYTSDRSGRVQIYRKPLAGGKEERVTFQGNENDRAVFSPDGKLLATVQGNGGEYRIAVLELETGQVRVLTEGKLDESPSFAPNGSMILYARTYLKTGEEVLSAVSVDGRFDFPLSEQGTSVREPAWSPF
jgi:TolB protein